MTEHFKLTDDALADLDEIYAWTAKTWSLDQADVYTAGLYADIEKWCSQKVFRRTLVIEGFEDFRYGRYRHHFVFFNEAKPDFLEV